MPPYLSPEWVHSFDTALRSVDLSDAIAAAGAGSLAAAVGTFSIVQIVTEVPAAIAGQQGTTDVRLVLTVDRGHAGVSVDAAGTAPGTATIVLGYTDALALARGELDPADALATGRIRARGDLAALVAWQEILAAAAARLGPALTDLTD